MELISREAVINAIEKTKSARTDDNEVYVAKVNLLMKIDALPSAQLSTNLAEVGTDCISRQSAIDAICNACGKIDCDKMDKCEKLQLPPANTSETPNSSDTISRQSAIEALTEYGNGRAVFISVGEAVIRIEQLPSAQPKKGKWISADAMFHGVPFYCSECGENTRDTVMGKPRWNYCPMCGADMREVTT